VFRVVAADRDALAAELAEAERRRGIALVLRAADDRGRSRLIEAVTAGIGDWRVVRLRPGRSVRLRPGRSGHPSDEPGAGLAMLAEQLVEAAPASRAAMGRYVQRMATDPAVDGSVQERADALIGALEGAVGQGPLLVVVDDAHLLDDASARGLISAARGPLAPGLALFFAVPHGADPRFEGSGLPLREVGQLSAAIAVAMIEEWTGRRPGADVVDRLVEHVDGAPQALSEVVRQLTPEQLLGWTALPTPLPAAADPELAERITTLPASARDALTIAALARVSDAAVIAEALRHVGGRLSDLEQAEGRGVVHLGVHGVHFRSSMLRALAVADRSPTQLRAAHGALARALADVAPGERSAVAHHLSGAASHPDRQVVDLLLKSADASASVGDLLTAARALSEAAELVATADERVELLLRAAQHAREAGVGAWSSDLADRAFVASASPRLRARAADARARVAIARGTGAGSLAALVAHAAAIAEDEPATAATLYLTATVAEVMRGSFAGVRQHAQRAAELAPASTRAAELASLWLQGIDAMAGNDVARFRVLELETRLPGASWNREEQQPAAVEDVVWARSWALFVRLHLGDLDDVRGGLRQLVSELEGSGRRGLVTLPLALLAMAEYRRGWWAAGAAHADRVRVVGLDSGQPAADANGRIVLALIAAARGDRDVCAEHVAAIRRSAELSGSELLLGYATAAEGLLELGAGRPEEAVSRLEEARRLAIRIGLRPAVLASDGDLLQAYVETNRLDRAEQLLTLLEQGSEGSGWTAAIVARGQAMLTAGGAYDELIDASVSWLADQALPFEQARTQLVAAELHLRDGEHASAVRLAGAAWTIFRSLGAAPWAERCNRLRRAAEVAGRSENALEELSEQERRVATLVAAGATNREVATELVLSPKTIEYHLHNIYTKLDLTSRSQLVRFVLESGTDR
jgi:DNA-binding CsgD family transcriptional regulator